MSDLAERLRISRTFVRGAGDVGYDVTGEPSKSTVPGDGKPVGFVEDERREAAVRIEQLERVANAAITSLASYDKDLAEHHRAALGEDS